MKKLTIYLAAIVLVSVFCVRYAGADIANSLTVTEVHLDSGTYRVNIGNAVEIRNIVIVSSNGITNALFPRGVNVLNDEVKNSVTDAIAKGFTSKAGKVPLKKKHWRTSPMSFKIGDIIFSTGSVRTRLSGSKGKPLHADHGSMVTSDGSKARCVVTFNNSLELTAYIFDRNNKRGIFWPRSVKFKNYRLSKMIGNSVMSKYRAVTGEK